MEESTLLKSFTAPLICETCWKSTVGFSSSTNMCNCCSNTCKKCRRVFKCTDIETLARAMVGHTCVPGKEVPPNVPQSGVFTGDPEIDDMMQKVVSTIGTKGAEYTIGSVDRLANFRRASDRAKLRGKPIEMEDVWYIFFDKHFSAVDSYFKNGNKVISNEHISGRVMDCIVYFFLLHKIICEYEKKTTK